MTSRRGTTASPGGLMDPEHWQQKYNHALARLETEQARWRQLEEILRRLVVRLCLVAHGIDPQLDAPVDRLASAIRRLEGHDELKGILDQLTDTLAALDLAPRTDAAPAPAAASFEPTAAQGEILRPLGEDSQGAGLLPGMAPTQGANTPLTPPQAQESAIDEAAAQQRAATTRNLIFAGVILIALVLLVIPVIWKNRLYQRLPSLPILLESTFRRAGIRPPKALRRWFQLATLSPINKAYQEVNNALIRLGSRPALHHTPAERVQALVELLPEANEPAGRLLTEYQTSTYSLQSADLTSARQSGVLIRKLSLRAAFQRFVSGPKEPEDAKEELFRSLRW